MAQKSTTVDLLALELTTECSYFIWEAFNNIYMQFGATKCKVIWIYSLKNKAISFLQTVPFKTAIHQVLSRMHKTITFLLSFSPFTTVNISTVYLQNNLKMPTSAGKEQSKFSYCHRSFCNCIFTDCISPLLCGKKTICSSLFCLWSFTHVYATRLPKQHKP